MVFALLLACLFWRKSVLCLPTKHVWNDLVDTDKTVFDERNSGTGVFSGTWKYIIKKRKKKSLDIKYKPFNAASGQLSPRKIEPTGNFPLDIFPSDNCTRTITLVDNCPRAITPQITAPGQLPRKVVLWMISYLHNFIIAQWTVPPPPRKIVPKINYTGDIFSRRIGNRSTLIDDWFFLFSFLVFKISSRLSCKKKLCKHSETETA